MSLLNEKWRYLLPPSSQRQVEQLSEINLASDMFFRVSDADKTQDKPTVADKHDITFVSKKSIFNYRLVLLLALWLYF